MLPGLGAPLVTVWQHHVRGSTTTAVKHFHMCSVPLLKGVQLKQTMEKSTGKKIKIVLRFAGQAVARKETMSSFLGLWISGDHGKNDINTVEALRVFLFIHLFPSLQFPTADISKDLKGHSPVHQITEQVGAPPLRKNINPSTVHHPAPSASHPPHRRGSKREPSSYNPSVRPSCDDGSVQAHKKLQLSYPLLTVLEKTKQSYRITWTLEDYRGP